MYADAVWLDDAGDHRYVRRYFEGEWVGIDEYHVTASGAVCRSGGWIAFVGSIVDTGDGWTRCEPGPADAEPVAAVPGLREPRFHQRRKVGAGVNYYDARELADHSGWRFTCQNDGRIWAVGYCADGHTHATQLEAYECYTGYLLDTRLRLDGDHPDTQRRCAGPDCRAWTTRYGEVDMQMWDLCDEHRTREVVAKLLGTVGASISSW